MLEANVGCSCFVSGVEEGIANAEFFGLVSATAQKRTLLGRNYGVVGIIIVINHTAHTGWLSFSLWLCVGKAGLGVSCRFWMSIMVHYLISSSQFRNRSCQMEL